MENLTKQGLTNGPNISYTRYVVLQIHKILYQKKNPIATYFSIHRLEKHLLAATSHNFLFSLLRSVKKGKNHSRAMPIRP